MQYTAQRVQAASAEFKNRCVEALNESNLTQEALADSLSATQSTISRWFSYTSDLHLPAFALALLPHEVALKLLEPIVQAHGYALRKLVPVAGELNASIEDEALEIVEHLGKLSGNWRARDRDIRLCTRDVQRLRQVVDKMDEELKRMRGR